MTFRQLQRRRCAALQLRDIWDMPADIEPVLKRIYDDNPAWWPYGLRRDMLDDAFEVTEATTGKSAGFVGWQFRHDPDGRKVGYYAVGMLPEFRGKGYAKEALQKLIANKPSGVDLVRAFIVAGNAPSEGLAKSLGVPVVHKSASLRPVAPWVTFASMKSARNIVPSSYGGVSLQQYLPMVQRREKFSPDEEQAISAGKDQWFPQVFTSMADSPAVDMHSPGKGALLAGLGAGGLVAGGTHFLGGSPKVTAGAGALGGVLSALAAYHAINANNQGTEEMMRRIPEGGTRRDMLSDPVLQAEQERSSHNAAGEEAMRTAQLLAVMQAASKRASAKSAAVGKILGLARATPGFLKAQALPWTAAGATAGVYDAATQAMKPGDFGSNYTNPENRSARFVTGLVNTLLTRGAMMSAKGTSAAMGANPAMQGVAQYSATLPAFGGLAFKDIAMNNLYTGHEIVDALKKPDAATNVTVNNPAAPGMSNLQKAGLALGGAGVVAGGGYLASKLIDALRNASAVQAGAQGGRLRVTLPTRKPGDVETQIEMPFDQVQLSNTTHGRLVRDVRQHLRSETQGRTKKVTLSPEERQRRAALLAAYR